MKYTCPLCKSALTELHYHRVMKLRAQEEQTQKGQLEKMAQRLELANQTAATARKRILEVKQRAKEELGKVRQQATLAERRRSERLMQGQSAKMKKLQDRIKMLESGTTPQGIGLADEGVLVARLKKEFPEDRIQHTGKGGDVLHYVNFNRQEVGCMVYECKHTERISGQHVDQTALAMRTREANFGILVTTGRRTGFSGLAQESGIFIVAQAGALTLAHICRDSLIAMAKQRLDAAAKEAAAKRLMDFVMSPTCRTPLEQAISQAERAGKKLIQEMQQHRRDWMERSEIYQTIHHDVSHVRKNISLVLDGEEPIRLAKPKFERLMLPPIT